MQSKLNCALLLLLISLLVFQPVKAQVNPVQNSIEAACPCNGPVSGGQWPGHSEYVSCVTAKVNQLAAMGTIAKNQKSGYITGAAQSDCGKGIITIPDPIIPEDSPGELSFTGVNEKTFNPQNVNLAFTIANANFSSNPNDFVIIRNGAIINPSINLSSTSVSYALNLIDGLNEVLFLAADANGFALEKKLKLWAGSGNLSLRIINEAGSLVPNANVKVNLGDDPNVFAEGNTATGLISFQNIPLRTIIETASAPGSLYGTTATVGGGSNVNLKVYGINAPSTVSNNDFSQGTLGWVIGAAPVQIIEHSEGLPLQKIMSNLQGNITTQAISNPDLQLSTSGEGSQHISRTFFSTPGTKNITVKFRFITSEVPGGFFGSQYNDMYSIVIKSSVGNTSESKAMNELGLGAFDYNTGATNWREISLPVNVDGDIIHVDISVTNVGDGAYDSKVVVDYVGEKKLAITDAVFFDPDKSGLLTFLSLDNHTYFGGKVPIYGALSFKGAAADRLKSVALEVLKGNTVLTNVPLSTDSEGDLYQVFGSDETIQMNFKKLLFEIPSTTPQLSDGKLQLRINAETDNGEKISFIYGSFPNLKLYQEFGTDKRFGATTRDAGEGGDGWALPSTIDFIAGLPAGWLVNDISNMNGGNFIGHQTHTYGNDIDLKFTGYINRDAAVANTLIDFLNSPQGSRVAFIYVTYSQTSVFYNAIKDVMIGNQKATSIILNRTNHEDHFHIGVNPSVQSSKLGTPTIRPARKQPVVLQSADSDFMIFPNPAQEGIHVQSRLNNETIGEVRIYNSAGMLLRQHVYQNLKKVKIQTAGLKPGSYIMQVSGKMKTERIPLVITQ
jgi:hypothetical protein